MPRPSFVPHWCCVSGGSQHAVSILLAVALIVVLDQFTRHVYRGHAERGKMGGGEPNNARALGCAEQLLDRG